MKTGIKLASANCETEVIVVRGAEVELQCGGTAMVEAGAERTLGAPDEAMAGGTELGKRYVHADSGLQVLCVKPGLGTLAVDGIALDLLASKQLPSSD